MDAASTAGWSLTDGGVTATGRANEPASWLMSEASFTDFVARFQFKVSKGANGGFGVQAAKSPDKVNGDLLEIQVQDDTSNDRDTTGSFFLYSAAPSYLKPDKPANLKPVGEWNTMDVDLRGKTLKVRVNGDVVRFTDLEEAGKKRAVKPAFHRLNGRLAFQKMLGEVSYRNLEVLDLR